MAEPEQAAGSAPRILNEFVEAEAEYVPRRLYSCEVAEMWSIPRLDYFIDDHWAKLPESWQVCFHHMDPQELGNILAGASPKIVLPLSFLALLKTISVLSIAREPVTSATNINLEDSSVEIEKPEIITNSDLSCGDHPRLQNLFLKHVKAKKRHEIALMCNTVAQTSKECRCSAVVDVGSGLGHLVRSLAYRHDMITAGIERQPRLTAEARKLDLELEYTASKHLSDTSMKSLKRPIHLNASLSADSSFEALDLPESMREYGVVGLHPCGDLGPFLLRHFVRSERVRFICVVGCCYMKLSCEGPRRDRGYPMSDFLAAQPCPLSFESREIACHAIETYVQRLRKGAYHDLQVHAYRAALEVILVDLDKNLKHSGVRSIKHTDALSFERYCALAVERLGVSVPEAMARGASARSHLAQWRRVVTFYTLRLAVAPLVETLVLLDRALFLLERGFSCDIWPVFDPHVSPRNHIIIGKKL